MLVCIVRPAETSLMVFITVILDCNCCVLPSAYTGCVHISSCKSVYVRNIESCVNPNLIEHVYCVSSAATPRPRWLRDKIIKWHKHPPVRRVSGKLC